MTEAASAARQSWGAMASSSLAAYAADKRRRVESAGLTLPSGTEIQTERGSQVFQSTNRGIVMEPVKCMAASGFVLLE